MLELLRRKEPTLPDLGETDCVLRIEPGFFAKLNEAEVHTMLEHELRHVTDSLANSPLALVVNGMGALDHSAMSTLPSLISAALQHFFLRAHAIQSGRRDFVERDIMLAFSTGSGALHRLHDLAPMWLACVIAAHLEYSCVFQVAGDERSAVDLGATVDARIARVVAHAFVLFRTPKFEIMDLLRTGARYARTIADSAMQLAHATKGNPGGADRVPLYKLVQAACQEEHHFYDWPRSIDDLLMEHLQRKLDRG